MEATKPFPVDPKRSGVKAKLVRFTDDEFGGYAEPGSVEPHEDYLLNACPGCGRVTGMCVAHPKPDKGPSWDIVSGSLNEPESLTLAPSINCIGCCGWHGYLRNGVFESC